MSEHPEVAHARRKYWAAKNKYGPASGYVKELWNFYRYLAGVHGES